MGFSCANCVVGYSEIQIDEQVGIEEKVKNLEYHYLSSNLNGATFFRSKLSGAAKGIDYSGARFIYSDVSSMDFDGANISGAQFDVFDADKAIQTSDFVDLDNVVKIFYRGYSDPQRSLEIAEEKFDADMRTTDTSAEALERYPSDGFAKAWAWSDRPPIGIPEGVSGPILCDAALRKDNADVTPSMPEGCKIGAHSSAKR